MANRLGMRNVRAVPNQVANTGGTISVQFEARTNDATAVASVQYAVGSGPFRVTGGATASPTVTTTEKTVRQNVTIARTQPQSVSSIRIDVTGKIPGDTNQTHPCRVWINNPVAVHVRNFRTAEGLTQKELGQKLGVSATTISKIEGGRAPSSALEEAIAGVLG